MKQIDKLTMDLELIKKSISFIEKSISDISEMLKNHINDEDVRYNALDELKAEKEEMKKKASKEEMDFIKEKVSTLEGQRNWIVGIVLTGVVSSILALVLK